MYLNLLDYKDKKLFFALANKIVNIDGEITDSEIEIMETFRNEMNLINIDDMAEYDLVEIVDLITEDIIIKKIIIFELVSLAYVDSDFSEEEKNIIKLIRARWNITDELFDKLQELASELMSVTSQISETILSD